MLKLPGGHYSALSFTIKARRRLSYHLMQTYLLSVLLIAITLLCFLLPASMVEARIGVCMTTLLTLTAMFAAVRLVINVDVIKFAISWTHVSLYREQSPQVSYNMAIGRYTFTSLYCENKSYFKPFICTEIICLKDKINQFACIDSWMVFCILIVFIALLLFSTIFW